MLDRVQEQLTRRWERNQALVTHTRDRLAQYEAGLMDLREALNRAVGTTREAEELNSRNQERLEEALVESWPRPSSSLPPWTLHPVTPTPLLSTSPLFCYLPRSPHHHPLIQGYSVC